MGKRGNEHAQLKPHEYEDAIEKGSETPAGTFQKADPQTLSGRRIIRSSRKYKNVQSPGGNSGKGAFANFSFRPNGSSSQGAAPAPAPPASGGNAFANFSFTPGGSSTSAAVSAPAPAPPTGKPAFAMPTLPSGVNSNATSFWFGGTSTTTTAASASAANNDSNNEGLSKLCASFREYVKNMDVRESQALPVSRFITTAMQLRQKVEKQKPTSETAIAAAAAASSSPAAPSNKPLFPAPSTAPVPVAFESFASAPAPPKTLAAPGPPKLSFVTPADTSTSSTAPAPVPMSVTGAPAAPPSLQAPAAVSSTSEEGKKKESEGEPAVLEGEADKDWNNVNKTGVVFLYHYRDNKVPKKFAKGTLKLQEHKEDSMNRRAVMRNETGKVVFNVAISKGLTFEKRSDKARNQHRIIFNAVEDAKRGPEMFMLRCKEERIDELHKKLISMAQ